MARKTEQQTQRCLPLEAMTNQRSFIDVAEILSITNKRLYRQNRVYRCRVTLRPTFLSGATEGFTGEVYALNNTWTNRRAYAMAMQAWLDAQEDEVQLMKSRGLPMAKWRDFKTKLGTADTRVGPMGPKYNSTTNVYEMDSLTPTAGNYDWDASTVSVDLITGPTEYGFNWLASAGNNFNIIEQFSRIYNVQQQPDTAFDFNTPYDELEVYTNRVTDIEFEGLQEDGNEPPYDKNIVDNVLAHVGTLGSVFVDPAAAGNDGYELTMMDTGWFDAPCGFIIFNGGLFADLNDMDLCIEVAVGDYKGVKAPEFVTITKKGGKYLCR